MTLHTGHGSVTLDVPPGTPLGGYARREGPSTGTLDPVELHAMTFRACGRRFTWLVADVPAINTDVATALPSRLDADPALLWFGATHTHSGPETGCFPGGAATPSPWDTLLLDAAASAASAAIAAEEPANLTVHTGLITGVGGQRSGPHPRLDVPVDVLALRRDGRVRGAVVVLPVHPTVLSAANRLVSADLAGALRRALSTRLGAPVLLATGAAGDVSTRAHRRAQDPAELSRLGALAADQVTALLTQPGTAIDVDTVEGALNPAFSLPDRRGEPPPDTSAARFRQASARNPVEAREAEMAFLGAELAASARIPDPHVPIAALRLGNLRLTALGAEPYLAARDLAEPAIMVGYTGGYLGYLPTRDAYRTDVYEVNISPVAAGAAELAATEARRLQTTLG